MAEKTVTPLIAANDNHHDFYVYAWLRPNGEPFYIGKGRGRRDGQIKYSNPFFVKVVEKIRADGSEPTVIRWQDGLCEEDAFRLERAYIKLFGRRNNRTGVLVNLTDGGDGLSGAIFSESHRQKIARGRTGKRHTAETRLALSIAKSGKPISDSHREAISAAQIGRTHSEETKKKISDRNKNKVISSEVRAKIVSTMTGRKLPKAHVENMRAAVAMRYTIPEEREKTAQAVRRTPPDSRNSSAFKGVSQRMRVDLSPV